MTDKEIVERAKEAEKMTGFGELVHSPISKGVNSAFGIGFIEGMVEYRNSLQEESVNNGLDLGCGVIWKDEAPVSEDLEYASEKYACRFSSSKYGHDKVKDAFIAGADWKKEHLWKPADGDDLPEIDREVIALLDNGKVVFAHRPPEYWDGKDIVTGKVTRNYPKTYDKGGWNIPNIKYWLDVELPKEIEQ